MRNLLALLAALLLLFCGLGWWRSWYSVQPEPAESGRSAFHVEVDRVKIGNDLIAAARWLQRSLKSESQNEGERKSE
jgi:hypothetical protein